MVRQYNIKDNNRIMTLDNRLVIYEKINKFLTNDFNTTDKCIEYDKKIDKLKLNNIIFDKRIGSLSAVGIIMLGTIKNKKIIIKITEKDDNKLLKFLKST